MKNLLLIICFCFCCHLSASAYDGRISILNSAVVELSINDYLSDFIVSSTFNLDDNNIDIQFSTAINLIQVFDLEGELISIIPIDSNDVRMGLSLFEEGNYKLGFLIEGVSEIQYADISINN